MNYETFLAVVKRTERVKLSDAQDLLEELYFDAVTSDDAIESYTKIYDLVDFIIDKKFVGDSDDYHNIAVICAREDDYDVACRFLDRGLDDNPDSVDLLADYISYGSKCGLKDKCEESRERLKRLRDKWNWRAFSFTIDYLEEQKDTNNIDEIYDLIQAYKKKIPDIEDPYLSEARFLKAHPDYIRATGNSYVSLLEKVVSGEESVKRTPVCDLELADYYYNTENDIEKAIKYLEKCKEDSVQTQPSVNRSYVYLMLSLCYLDWYYRLHDDADINEKENMIQKCYDYYHVASLETYDSRVRSSRRLIEGLVRESGIQYTYDDNVVA